MLAGAQQKLVKANQRAAHLQSEARESHFSFFFFFPPPAFFPASARSIPPERGQAIAFPPPSL
jgi:hypothetical protein